MKRILLVEDENSLKQGLQFMLESAGYQIVSASDAEQAQIIFNENEFDLIITDLILPKGDARTIIQMARKKFSQFPIICVTAYADTELARSVKRMVGDLLFEKPIQLHQLLDNIRTIFRQKVTSF